MKNPIAGEPAGQIYHFPRTDDCHKVGLQGLAALELRGGEGRLGSWSWGGTLRDVDSPHHARTYT